MMNNEGPPHFQRDFGFRVNILTFLEEILLIRSFSIFHEKQSIEERFSDIKMFDSFPQNIDTLLT